MNTGIHNEHWPPGPPPNEDEEVVEEMGRLAEEKRAEMTAERKELIPPDLKRCQRIHRVGAFQFGPPREWQCDKKAAFVAMEDEPNKDGQRGSMSVCIECKELLKGVRPTGLTFVSVKSYPELIDILKAHGLVP